MTKTAGNCGEVLVDTEEIKVKGIFGKEVGLKFFIHETRSQETRS